MREALAKGNDAGEEKSGPRNETSAPASGLPERERCCDLSEEYPCPALKIK